MLVIIPALQVAAVYGTIDMNIASKLLFDDNLSFASRQCMHVDASVCGVPSTKAGSLRAPGDDDSSETEHCRMKGFGLVVIIRPNQHSVCLLT
jgi:hypothetical protein